LLNLFELDVYICSLNFHFHFQTVSCWSYLLTFFVCICIVPINLNYILSERESPLPLFRSPLKICLIYPLQFNHLRNTMSSWTFQMYQPKHQLYLKWLRMMLKFPRREKVSLSLSLSLSLEFTFLLTAKCLTIFETQLWRNRCRLDWEEVDRHCHRHHMKLFSSMDHLLATGIYLCIWYSFFIYFYYYYFFPAYGFLQLCTIFNYLGFFQQKEFPYWAVQIFIFTMLFMYKVKVLQNSGSPESGHIKSFMFLGYYQLLFKVCFLT
jgi:hypothetical protein